MKGLNISINSDKLLSFGDVYERIIRMKKQSIQFKFLAVVISAMLAVAIFIGGLSIYLVDRFVQQQSMDFVDATCSNETTKINDMFSDMEKSVNIMGSYVLDFIRTKSDVENQDKRNEIITRTEEMFSEVAKYTSGTIAYYLRFDPTLSNSTSGIFYSKVAGGEEYVRFEPTDLALYDRDDVEHVGWFWQPYDKGAPVWMLPYNNQNNDVCMISYVVPLYRENVFLGVVGMDFDYTVLTDRVKAIKVYENGFAYLEMHGKVMYYNGEEELITASDAEESYMQVSGHLLNGMTLVFSACYEDIRQIRYDIAFQILLVVIVLAVLFSLIAIFMVKNVVSPLEKLTEASKKLSRGDYSVDIEHSDTYEISLLSYAFENMAMHLQEHKRLQHLLAYRDALTGLRNVTSYNSWVKDFDKKIQEQEEGFAVIVFDINYLKEVNDHYGHDIGNKLIIAVGKIIGDTFYRSPVFRIGGDEFVAVIQNKDLAECDDLMKRLDSECASQFLEIGEEKISISVARGLAEYNPENDESFADVFKRADDAMYKNKRVMKSAL